jgi:hypothetical protein
MTKATLFSKDTHLSMHNMHKAITFGCQPLAVPFFVASPHGLTLWPKGTAQI